jgi:hypothetical protein
LASGGEGGSDAGPEGRGIGVGDSVRVSNVGVFWLDGAHSHSSGGRHASGSWCLSAQDHRFEAPLRGDLAGGVGLVVGVSRSEMDMEDLSHTGQPFAQ